MTEANIVPFGKYKGQPAELLLADPEYCEWLLAQPWFQSRYPRINQTIINFGGEPADSPEHNQLQASFLDDDRCLALARLLNKRPFDRDAARKVLVDSPTSQLARRYHDHLTATVEDPYVVARRFEADGWDVRYEVAPAQLVLEANTLPQCTCGPCDHSACDHGEDFTHCWRHQRHERNRILDLDHNTGSSITDAHCYESCPWHQPHAVWLLGEPQYNSVRSPGRIFEAPQPASVLVECKPDLGDDYPAVLRQVLRYPYAGWRTEQRCVVVRRHRFAQVTWEQVVAIFAESQVALLTEAAVNQ